MPVIAPIVVGGLKVVGSTAVKKIAVSVASSLLLDELRSLINNAKVSKQRRARNQEATEHKRVRASFTAYVNTLNNLDESLGDAKMNRSELSEICLVLTDLKGEPFSDSFDECPLIGRYEVEEASKLLAKVSTQAQCNASSETTTNTEV